MIRRAAAVLLAVSLGGCVSTVVGTAVHVATAPVRIVGAGINTIAPGQKERDRRRGKKARKAEEAQRKADRKGAADAARAKRDAASPR